MKPQVKPRKRSRQACQISAGILALIFCKEIRAQTNPPGLSISLYATNQVQLVVTNAVGGQIYDLYRRPSFDLVSPWRMAMPGAVAQTSFVAEMENNNVSFFQARFGPDWDQDGALDWKDANPTSTTCGESGNKLSLSRTQSQTTPSEVRCWF